MPRTASTPRTPAAGRAPAHDHPVAHADVLDAFANRLDDTGPLVAEHDRRHLPPAARPDDVQVRVADAAGLDPDERLALARRLELECLDRHAAGRCQDDAAIHDSSTSAALRAPTRARVMSKSAISWRMTASAPARPATARPYA